MEFVPVNSEQKDNKLIVYDGGFQIQQYLENECPIGYNIPKTSLVSYGYAKDMPKNLYNFTNTFKGEDVVFLTKGKVDGEVACFDFGMLSEWDQRCFVKLISQICELEPFGKLACLF